MTNTGSVTLGSGGSRGFVYDAAGNGTLDNRTGGAYTYTYDSAGRMATFSINGVLQASYKYDYQGRQVVRALSGGTTIHSVFDAHGNRIAEYNETTGTLIREYVWLEGQLIAVIEGGVISFVRADHIGRPVFATNSAGAKVWTASYLPFGGVRTSTGTPSLLRFPGQWFQSESGLHQNWMRDYDPTTGRYVEADPLGLVDGASVFTYVKSNPGKTIDPKGTEGITLVPSPLFSPIPGTRMPSAHDYGRAWDELLQLSHNYNPIDLAIQWCTSGGEDECDKLNRIDTDTCNGITRLWGKRSGAICLASASDRYAACRAGRPIPPLNTWNN